jgi:hypothetical protein
LLLAVLGTLTVVVVAVMARRLFGRGPGLAAGLIAALCPPLVLIGASLEVGSSRRFSRGSPGRCSCSAVASGVRRGRGGRSRPSSC